MSRIVAAVMLLVSAACVVVVALTTKNANGYSPDPRAWLIALVLPGLLLLGVTAYYHRKKPY
jgi:threonine/homoserine/homoserine lactone efflux protein